MRLSLQILYPATAGTTFNLHYCCDTHLPMVPGQFGPLMDSILVTHGGPAPDGTPASLHAIVTLIFADKDALMAALEKAGPLLAGIPNFTDCAPQMVFGHVVT